MKIILLLLLIILIYFLHNNYETFYLNNSLINNNAVNFGGFSRIGFNYPEDSYLKLSGNVGYSHFLSIPEVPHPHPIIYSHFLPKYNKKRFLIFNKKGKVIDMTHIKPKLKKFNCPKNLTHDFICYLTN